MKTVIVNNVLWTMHFTEKGVWVYQGSPRSNWKNEGGSIFPDEKSALSYMDWHERPRVQFNVWG